MDNSSCIDRFDRKKHILLKCFDACMWRTYSECVTDLFPRFSKHMTFDHNTDHDEPESMFQISVCGHPYELAQCKSCKKILFVKKVKK